MKADYMYISQPNKEPRKVPLNYSQASHDQNDDDMFNTVGWTLVGKGVRKFTLNFHSFRYYSLKNIERFVIKNKD